MLNFYQHLSGLINPIAFSIGSFEIRWYAIMYLVGFFVIYALLLFRIKKGETSSLIISNFQFPISNKISNKKIQNFKTLVFDLLLYIFIGLVIGGRLGYVLFYNLSYFFAHPMEIFLPFQFSDAGVIFSGISGMSYHGGLIGAILAGYIFAKKCRLDFWKLADFVVPAIPAGYFFGRLGNFLNGELFGRAMTKPWGMYFADGLPGQGILRHPSQLYEAFFEGLVIFVILWHLRNQKTSDVSRPKQPKDIGCPPGGMLLLYLFLYGLFRFIIEFFREPDPQIGLLADFLSLGQLFSLATILMGILLYFFLKKRYNKGDEKH